MASAAQITANRANAQSSTGPRTPEGKAAAARNRTTHGLSSHAFFLLPDEDSEAFDALLAACRAEHCPGSSSESFLVDELARCQWKLRRVAAVEAGLLACGGSSPSQVFQADLTGAQVLLKLGRYETRIRRDWYRALSELRALRRDTARALAAEARYQQAESGARFTRMLEDIDRPVSLATLAAAAQTPAPDPRPVPAADPPGPAAPYSSPCHSKPMPAHLERELAAHLRRDPLFDPAMDSSQMSKELRRWYQKSKQAAL
jgi:hypothetical protein